MRPQQFLVSVIIKHGKYNKRCYHPISANRCSEIPHTGPFIFHPLPSSSQIFSAPKTFYDHSPLNLITFQLDGVALFVQNPATSVTMLNIQVKSSVLPLQPYKATSICCSLFVLLKNMQYLSLALTQLQI